MEERRESKYSVLVETRMEREVNYSLSEKVKMMGGLQYQREETDVYPVIPKKGYLRAL